jgi:RND family efflux transporter MFP subunit
VIRAPVAGSISERLVQPGEFIRENIPVATIVQMSPLKLKTAIQEKNASLIKPGQAVEFDVEAFANRKFKGTIAYVSPAVDQATRTFAVEALVDNSDRQLKPGFFAKGVVLTRVDASVLAVPEDAISTLAGVSTVYVIENGKARQQQISLGTRQNKLVEVTTGLKGDEKLATTNLSQLATGVSVRPEDDNGHRGARP